MLIASIWSLTKYELLYHGYALESLIITWVHKNITRYLTPLNQWLLLPNNAMITV